jgi:hypothetical protein
MNKININSVKKDLPVFSVDISKYQEALFLAKEAIIELKQKDPTSIESNVKAEYVSPWLSHTINPKFQPIIELATSCASFISDSFLNQKLEFYCFNCWGMEYGPGDYSIKHCHYPTEFSAVIYLDVSEDSAPIIFEDTLTINPKSGMMLLFPGILHHEVPKTNARRTVVAMNLHRKEQK